MAHDPIVQEGDPVLRRVAKAVPKKEQEKKSKLKFKKRDRE